MKTLSTNKQARGAMKEAIERLTRPDGARLLRGILDLLAAGNLFSGGNLAWLAAQLEERPIAKPGRFLHFREIDAQGRRLESMTTAFHIMRPRMLPRGRTTFDKVPVFCEGQCLPDVATVRREREAHDRAIVILVRRGLGKGAELPAIIDGVAESSGGEGLVGGHERWLGRQLLADVLRRTIAYPDRLLTEPALPFEWRADEAAVKRHLKSLSASTRKARFFLQLDKGAPGAEDSTIDA